MLARMIKQLFETHLPVRNLEAAMAFYDRLPGFSLGHLEPQRRIAFYFIGGWNNTMLGLWEKPEDEVRPLHVAFQIEQADVEAAMAKLHENGVQPLDFFGQPSDDPTVFLWMPAVGIYFNDVDGHLLELIATLPGEPDAAKGLRAYSEWKNAHETV